MDDQNQNVQDPIESTDIPQTPVQTSMDQNDAMVLLNLEDMIKAHIARISKLEAETREQKEMLDNVLANSEVYREHSEAAKEAAKIKSATRAEIMKQPSVMQVAAKVKDMKSELSEIQSTLSEYLAEYQRLAKTNIIEAEDGEHEIVPKYKLVKRASKK
jgi:hypothetical protein